MSRERIKYGFDRASNRNYRDNLVANEITGITASTGTVWATPAQDAVGNMTTMPQPASPANG